MILQQVRWYLCVAQDSFPSLWSLRRCRPICLPGLTGCVSMLPANPPWSNLYHLLALISTTFLLQPHTPPWCFCPKPSLLLHQGFRTCCFLGLAFSFSQMSSKCISSLPASVCSGRTLSWRPRWPPYIKSSSRLLSIPFLLLSSLLQMSSLECICLLMSRLLPPVYTVEALADEIESLREINLPTLKESS